MAADEPAAPRDVAVPESSAIVADASAVVPVRCKNCDAMLLGRFCANCSQAADVHVPTTRELLHELLEGVTHSDSRLWRTLTTLWFKPGKLTEEFVAGRRVAYLPPFRLYLVLSILFFLLASFVRIDNVEVMNFDDALKADKPAAGASVPAAQSINRCANVDIPAHPAWSARIKRACEATVRDNGASWVHVVLATLPKAMFIFLPLIAFLHMLLYWRPRHRYAEHLLFFLHLHAFFFSVMALTMLSGVAAAAWPRTSLVWRLVPLLLWSLPVYTVLAMRLVFGRSWTRTLVQASALFIVYMVVMMIALTGVFVYAMLQL